MKKLSIILLLIFSYSLIHAAILKGKVTDEKGEVLPFASIYIKGTTKGTTTNADGFYKLEVANGEHTFICHYVGFKKEELLLNITENEMTHNFKLISNSKDLKEVVIKNEENLAIAIIKKTIAKRSFYNKQIDAYSANAYNKGNFKLDDVPNLGALGNMLGGGKKGGNEAKEEMEKMKGIISLSETFSEIYYKQPNKLKIIVKSSKVSGDKNGYGFSYPLFINFYDNNVEIPSNPRGFISPIAETAMLNYKYELLSAYTDGNKLINRIKVTPRRNYEPCFSGIIEVIENEWRLNNVDLTVDKKAQLDMFESVQIKQIFVPVNDVLMVKDQSFKIKMKFMGFGVTGNFVNVFSDYVFDYDTKKAFDKYQLEYKDDALKKPKEYWNDRPVPLDQEEIADYKKKDSIEIAENTKVDSVKKKNNTIRSVILNGAQIKINKNTSISTTSIIGLQNFNWNTVEGLNYKYGINYRHKIDEDRRINSSILMRYGVSNQQLNAKASISYQFGKSNKSNLSLKGGRYVFQYNNEEPVDEMINSLYTLFYGRNYLKFYEAYFGELKYKNEMANGIGMLASISYQDRNTLGNSNLYSFRKNNISFTENYPTEIQNGYEARHQAIISKIGLSYQPGRKYIKYPDRIVPISSKYPTFSAQIDYGMPVLNSDVDFSKYKISMWDNMDLNLWGTFKYRLSVGGFLHKNKLFVIDFTHFNGNQILLASPYLNSFQLSPYYANSNTESFYMKANIEHHFYGMLTNKIPLFNRLKWYLVASSNAYYVNQNNNYIEASIGLENIGFNSITRFIRVDGVVGYSNFKTPVYGIRVGINSSAISIGKNDNGFE